MNININKGWMINRVKQIKNIKSFNYPSLPKILQAYKLKT